MFDLADIIKLIEVTDYKVERARAKEPILADLEHLPIIYVGFGNINAESAALREGFNAYELAAENLIQSFDVQICCLEKDLPIIWRKVYKSINGKNTQPSERQFSAIAYQKGGVIGIENSRLWWLDRWAVQFPSLNTFTF